jgi:hypothetical protein
MCGTWDSEQTPVKTVGVCGPKFDLCQKHRVHLLLSVKVPMEKAIKYVANFDARENVRGRAPTLASLAKADSNAPENGAQLQEGSTEATDGTVTLHMVANLGDGILTEAVVDESPTAEVPVTEVTESAGSESDDDVAVTSGDADTGTDAKPRRATRAKTR